MSQNVTLTIEPTQITVPIQMLLDQVLSKAGIKTASVPKIGQPWPGQGGIYAGVMRGEGDQPDYHLILAVDTTSIFSDIQWGGYGDTVPGADSEWDGQANTGAILSASGDHPAAEKVAAVMVDGHSDFYLPAKRESALLYANLPEQFEAAYYWTSTQRSAYDAVYQYFGYGNQGYGGEYDKLRARAVRRLIL